MQFFVIRRIFECQRHDTCVDQVCHVDSRETLGNDRSHTQIQRDQRRVLSGRPLPVVAAADDDAGSGCLRSFREGGVTNPEAELRQVWNIGTVRQDLGARRHDMVCCDIVAYLQNQWCLQRIFLRHAVRERFDVRSSENFDLIGLVCRRRSQHCAVIDLKRFRHRDLRHGAKEHRIGDLAGQSCCYRGLR